MPSPREIRRRIRSVRNVSQITRAMEMVAASKMRRAQERVTAGRPYSERLRDVLADLSSAQLDADQMARFPLLEQREVERSAVIFMTPDRGLSGALNSNLFRRGGLYFRENAAQEPQVIAVGKRGRDFLAKAGRNVVADFIQLGDRPTMDDTRPIAEAAIDMFLSGEVDAVHLIYPKFVNTLVQTPEVVQILPIERPEVDENRVSASEDYIFEPSAEDVLNAILPRYVEILIYQAQLETVASFYSAQMVAMRNATDNAKELVDDLNLSYNKARQAQITNEIAEISAAANAFRTD
jgi:F-type H+-transporting ATPase subunit gamma